MDGLHGPVEGARDEQLLVHDGKLVVHEGRIVVVTHLDPYNDTTRTRWAGMAPSPSATRATKAAPREVPPKGNDEGLQGAEHKIRAQTQHPA